MRREPQAWLLCQLLVLVVFGTPGAEADEPSPLRLAEENGPASSAPAILLAPRDGEGERAASPSLRLDLPPLALAMAESPVTLRVPAPTRKDPTQDGEDESPPTAWGRMDDAPPPLQLTALDEHTSPGGLQARRRPRSSIGHLSSPRRQCPVRGRPGAQEPLEHVRGCLVRPAQALRPVRGVRFQPRRPDFPRRGADVQDLTPPPAGLDGLRSSTLCHSGDHTASAGPIRPKSNRRAPQVGHRMHPSRRSRSADIHLKSCGVFSIW